MIELPAKFPPGTDFADVEGVPATFNEATGVCKAWDAAEPRWFSVSSFLRNGAPLSEREFRDMIAEAFSS